MFAMFTKALGFYRCTTRNFSWQGGFLELGHFNKYYAKVQEKRSCREYYFFIIDTLKSTF